MRNGGVICICQAPAVSALVSIKPELRSWIESNLDRGCPPEQLIAGMIERRFDPPIAQGLVRAFVDARNAGVPLTGDSVRIDTPAATYGNEAPRIPAGSSIRTADRIVSVVARLSRPIIAVLANVLSAEECAQLIALARPRLRPSTVVDPATGENRVAGYRNSDSMFFRPAETPLIATLDARFSEIMNLRGCRCCVTLRIPTARHSSRPILIFSCPAMRPVWNPSGAADSVSAAWSCI